MKFLTNTKLKLFRSFYLQYRGIRQTVSDESFAGVLKRQDVMGYICPRKKS